MMLTLLLLLAVGAVYVGTIETAFSALMRLSLRLMAERGGRNDRLGYYLDDPIQLFVPARLMLGLIFSLATVVIAVLTGRTGFQSIGMLLVFVAVFILLCEHVLPMLIVRRNPGARAGAAAAAVRLRRALPASADRHAGAAARGGPARSRAAGCADLTAAAEEEAGEAAHAYLEAGEEQGLIERDERRLLQSIVDFGDTLVREVMTPRPDIVAIQADATLDELRALFREQEYSRIPVYKENLDNILGIVFVKDSDSARRRRPARRMPLPAWCGRRRSCRRPSACRRCSRSSSASRCRWRSSSTSTAAPRAS